MATFELRSQFGRVRLYPVGPEATALCLISGSKTFQSVKLIYIKDLGLEFRVILNGLELENAE